MGEQIRIGFIGLGRMGAPIALALLEGGFPLTVFGRDAMRLAPILARGATRAASPAELAAASDVVFLCVTDTEAVQQLALGPRGLAEGGRPGAIVVDHSTIHPTATRAIAREIATRAAMHWLDAPVSGGPPAVARRALVVFVGGDAGILERVRPILSLYAGRITHMGPSGSGQTTKLLNQALVGIGFAALAETARLALACGIDASRLPEALADGRNDSRLLQEYFLRMVAGDRRLFGRIEILLKDLDMVGSLAREAASPMPLAALASELHRLAVAVGLGAEDNAALVDLYRR